jgi:hypothetical protein
MIFDRVERLYKEALMSPSLRNRALLMLLAVLAIALALSAPGAAQYCYYIQAWSCYYDTSGYCYLACPESSWCYGDVSGSPTCFQEGLDCCY